MFETGAYDSYKRFPIYNITYIVGKKVLNKKHICMHENLGNKINLTLQMDHAMNFLT